ncbi:AAA family ATPase [Adhaeribacter radiodurans]|uniref:EVE domain-containing protein n=1 Tax=Adhaeribacter radiodurans TaxID=2745197 RepID=A0A7L7LDN0_9BACT|nr:AAA family ATPase [Adhaeribacter radiodurans]QMU30509.1 EVE domain-containing protein [Adhaeribacter radiodurans]
MQYYNLQRLVFDHLSKKHQEDNSFTFSVRRKFSPGKENNYFIGTEKTGYFGFTFWLFPCYYPGAAIDATLFVFDRIKDDSFRLFFQFFTSRNPKDEPNEATLALEPEIYKRAIEAGLNVYRNSAEKKMAHTNIYKKDAIPFEEMEAILDEFISEIRSIMEPSIQVVKRKYPNWNDGTITKQAFDKNVKNLLSKINQPVSEVGNLPVVNEDTQEAPTKPNNINYWWLNCNPSMWKIEDFEVGQEQTYTTHNSKGNKRNVYKNFTQVQPGDLLIGYESTPTKRIKAILEITQGAHMDDDEGEVVDFKIVSFVPNQADWLQLKELPELANSQIMRNNQGSLFELTPEEYLAIYTLTQKSPGAKADTYTLEEADKELFIDKTTIQQIQASLKRKKNIILQGAPGVGKTFFAKRLAYLQMGKKDNSRVEMIQFHQSYGYEDFIRGFRPNEEGKFTLTNGVFYDFCRRASNDAGHDYFFIIDEINRGNLSKIFGELLMLIEQDKRGKNFAIPLTYRKEGEEKFFVPENVYIIGTLNTADRSLALVDYALRRRFTFWDIEPRYEDKFTNHLQQHAITDDLATAIAQNLTTLNCKIKEDKDLGVGFMVGHSYFCNIPKDKFEATSWYKEIVDQEIIPLLKEYWYDNHAKVQEARTLLSLI